MVRTEAGLTRGDRSELRPLDRLAERGAAALRNPGDAPSAGAIGARQTQEMGAAMQSAGADVVRIATEMQRRGRPGARQRRDEPAGRAALDLAYDPKTGYLNLRATPRCSA